MIIVSIIFGVVVGEIVGGIIVDKLGWYDKNSKATTTMRAIVIILSMIACAAFGMFTFAKDSVERVFSKPQASATETSSSCEKYEAVELPTYTPYRQASENQYVFKLTPQSDCFSIVGYNESELTLVVNFRTTGTYFYYNFPKDKYNAFIRADSLGTYFNNYIKGNYSYEKGNEQEQADLQDIIVEMESEYSYNDFRDDWIFENRDEIPEGEDPYDYFDEHFDD